MHILPLLAAVAAIGWLGYTYAIEKSRLVLGVAVFFTALVLHFVIVADDLVTLTIN